MRFLLLKNLSAQAEINLKGQWVRYRFCGIILIITNISFAAISFFVIRHGKGFSYHFIETIAIALFTFVITILAIVNSVRYRRLRQPIIKATKIVSLVSALVSMFSLETAMITVFGSAGDIYFKRIITTITGILVCFTIFVIGIVMIIKSTKEIKTIK